MYLSTNTLHLLTKKDMGDFHTIFDPSDGQKKQCLAACNTLTYDVLPTQASYPNQVTFSQTPEFCILVDKLRRSCSSHKRKSHCIENPIVDPWY